MVRLDLAHREEEDYDMRTVYCNFIFTIRKIEDIKPETIESVKKDLERLKSKYVDMELMDVIMKAI
jgi:hypothetical protein